MKIKSIGVTAQQEDNYSYLEANKKNCGIVCPVFIGFNFPGCAHFILPSGHEALKSRERCRSCDCLTDGCIVGQQCRWTGKNNLCHVKGMHETTSLYVGLMMAIYV